MRRDEKRREDNHPDNYRETVDNTAIDSDHCLNSASLSTVNCQLSIISLTMMSVIIALAVPTASSQSLIDFSYKTYGLENHEANVIQNASYLDGFFEKLYQLKT